MKMIRFVKVKIVCIYKNFLSEFFLQSMAHTLKDKFVRQSMSHTLKDKFVRQRASRPAAKPLQKIFFLQTWLNFYICPCETTTKKKFFVPFEFVENTRTNEKIEIDFRWQFARRDFPQKKTSTNYFLLKIFQTIFLMNGQTTLSQGCQGFYKQVNRLWF